jgi:hypothetical protein
MSNINWLVHATQTRKPADVYDLNEIVQTAEKKFSLNNGLQFVEIECVSSEDALRRSLAMCLTTLNRKETTFVKLLSRE